MHYLDVLNKCLICSLALRKRRTHGVTSDNPSLFPNKDVTLLELNITAMNEHMLEIKVLNLILSLLSMLILVS